MIEFFDANPLDRHFGKIDIMSLFSHVTMRLKDQQDCLISEI